jgi:hypothetical protein
MAIQARYAWDLHGAHDGFGLDIPQRHLVADRNGLGIVLLGGQGDGNRPEKSILAGHAVRLAAAMPVLASHETIQGSERANAHHDEVAGFPAGHRHSLQMLGLADLFLPGVALKKKGTQLSAPMWKNQITHSIASRPKDLLPCRDFGLALIGQLNNRARKANCRRIFLPL